MLYESKEKMNEYEILLDSRQPFMNRVGLAPRLFCRIPESSQEFILAPLASPSIMRHASKTDVNSEQRILQDRGI